MRQERFLTVDDGVKLHVVEQGPAGGPLVLFVHGFPEFWWTWHRQMDALSAAGFRCVAYDQRGYNLSDKPLGLDAVKLDRLCADVEAVVRSCNRASTFLVGHDWGALVSWETAMRRPHIVERLVTMNMPHPAVIRAQVWRPRHWWRLAYLWWFQLPALPEWALRARRFALIRDELEDSLTDEELARYVEAAGQPGALHVSVNYYRAALREYLSRNCEAAVIHAPTRVIWGARDRHIHRSLATPPKELVPRCQIHFIEDATHWVQADAPDEVNRQLLAFLG
jgi:pimeloyl-ACP methyl ester carboxylesterase